MINTTGDLPLYDRTARKVHQWTMAVLVVAGLTLGEIPGTVLLALAGGAMLPGRFWWPADVVRQLTWRVLGPAGILKRDGLSQGHGTRPPAPLTCGGTSVGAG